MPDYDKLAEQVVEARVEIGKQKIQIESISERVDDIKADVKDLGSKVDAGFEKIMTQSLNKAEKNTSFFKSLAFKLILVVAGATGIGAVATGTVNALADTEPTQQEQVLLDNQK